MNDEEEMKEKLILGNTPRHLALGPPFAVSVVLSLGHLLVRSHTCSLLPSPSVYPVSLPSASLLPPSRAKAT